MLLVTWTIIKYNGETKHLVAVWSRSSIIADAIALGKYIQKDLFNCFWILPITGKYKESIMSLKLFLQTIQ